MGWSTLLLWKIGIFFRGCEGCRIFWGWSSGSVCPNRPWLCLRSWSDQWRRAVHRREHLQVICSSTSAAQFWRSRDLIHWTSIWCSSPVGQTFVFLGWWRGRRSSPKASCGEFQICQDRQSAAIRLCRSRTASDWPWSLVEVMSWVWFRFAGQMLGSSLLAWKLRIV